MVIFHCYVSSPEGTVFFCISQSIEGIIHDIYIYIYIYISMIYIYIIYIYIYYIPLMNPVIPFPLPSEPWCWYIYLQNWVIFEANVDKYSSTMEHMGWLGVQVFHRVLKENFMTYIYICIYICIYIYVLYIYMYIYICIYIYVYIYMYIYIYSPYSMNMS